MPIAPRGDFDAGKLHALAKKAKNGAPGAEAFGISCGLRWRFADGGGQNWRGDAADRAGLGGEVQRPRPGRSHRPQSAGAALTMPIDIRS
jgi:hypothetical protein